MSMAKTIVADEIQKIGNITPYPFQHEIIEAIKQHIREQWNEIKTTDQVLFEPGVVEAYVSAGKTIMLGAIANHCNNVGGKTLVLARTGELVEQNSEECWNMDAKNSVFSASLGLKSTRYNTVVGTEGTVANALNKEFAEWTPHVILIDECHEVDWREVMKLYADPTYETNNQYAVILCHFMRKNPKVAIIGVTGTPYRGSESIMGHFWKHKLGPKVDREFLVDNGYILPTIFGYSQLEYDMHEWDGKSTSGTEDFSSSDLKKMGDKADIKLTHKIMKEVMELTKDRLGVLITCASEKHCKQAAEALPDGQWAIITQSTGTKKRRELLSKAKKGEIKYVLQIGCLTTGVNVPFWDTSVLLRRIGSLTLLTQLLGRGMRLLKPWQEKMGLRKTEHLCLDYSGTMEAMQQLFDDPILEDAQLEKSKKRKKEFKTCPKCHFENSDSARRCINRIIQEDGSKERCEHFWSSKECKKCGVQNDPCASECRGCGHEMIDPNEKLSGKHYGPDDWKNVLSMDIGPTRNGAIYVTIFFDSYDENNKQEVARLFFNPWSSQGGKQMWKQNFVNRFVASWPDRNMIGALPNAEAVMKHVKKFRKPVRATHRLNSKGKSVVHGLDFGTEQTLGGKRVAKN